MCNYKHRNITIGAEDQSQILHPLAVCYLNVGLRCFLAPVVIQADTVTISSAGVSNCNKCLDLGKLWRTVKRGDLIRTISTVFHIHTQGIFQYDCINDFSSKYLITGIAKYKFLFSHVVGTQFFFKI